MSEAEQLQLAQQWQASAEAFRPEEGRRRDSESSKGPWEVGELEREQKVP